MKTRRIICIITTLLTVLSCGNAQKKGGNNNLFEMMQVLSVVTADSLSTWQYVMNATTPVIDSIILDATDEVDLKKRMLGQELGYLVMEAITDKYLDLKAHGGSASSEELDRIVSDLQGALCCWFYSEDERLPHIWRDHYYVSNKNAEEPSNGFFHIMVSVPTPAQPAPNLYIYYPESAEGRPAIIFREHLDNDLVDDKFDVHDIVTLQDWYKKDEVEKGFPMYATADEDVVEKMLCNSVMYLLFQSRPASEGAPGEVEIARVHLEPFQIMWQELVKE